MVRPAGAADGVVINTLKSLSLFHPNGELKKEAYVEPHGSMVWEKAAALTELKKTSLYLDILQNRRNLRTELEAAAGIRTTRKRAADDFDPQDYWNKEIQRLKILVGSEDSSAESDSSDLDSPDEMQKDDCEYKPYDSFDVKTRNPHKCNPLNFTIHLSEAAWLEIKPKNGKLPGFHWTPVVFRHICLKVPNFRCAHRFRVGKVYKSLPHKYFDFYANCKECETYLYGVCKEKPLTDSEGVMIDISTYDTRHLGHKLRRPIFSIQRREAAQTLKYIKAAKYKSDLMNERMDYSDYEPPDMCTTYNYRRIRVEGRNEYIGLSGPKEVLESLFYLADNFSFVKEISTYPFRVWYWAQCQIDMWDSLKDIPDLSPVITVDAKGSLVKKTSADDDNRSPIFLYQLLTTVEKKYAPLSQMISSRHDTNVTTRWLTEWVKNVSYLPKQSVCDGALGLLNSLSWALNKCIYKVFCATCLLFLLRRIKVLPFQCLLTLDRAHFIKSITRWPALSAHKDITVRDFYVRSLAFASTSESFKEIRKIMVSLFIICESKYMPMNSECYCRFIWLKQKFATLEHDPVSNTNENANGTIAPTEMENSREEVQKELNDNVVLLWLQSLYTEAMKLRSMTGDLNTLPNKFQCALKDNLMYTFSQFVSWSKVMYKEFGINSEIVATSASNESYFKDLVHTHGFACPVSANKFVKHHMLVVNAQIIAARAKVKSKYGIVTVRPKIVKEESSAINCIQNKVVCSSTVLQNNVDTYIQVDEEKTSSAYDTRSRSKFELLYAAEDVIHNEIVTKSNLATSDQASEKKISVYDTPIKLKCKFPSRQKNGESKTKNLLVDRVYHYPMKNGGDSLIGKNLLFFMNTCAYDSTFEVFAYMYQTHTKVKAFIDTASETNDFFRSISSYCNETLTMDDIYHIRAQLLHPIADKKKLKTGIADCECNVNALIDILMRDQCPIERHLKCYDCFHARIDNCRNLLVQEATATRAFEKCSSNPTNNFLHICIADTLLGEMLRCRGCKKQTAVTQFKLETYVSFDLEQIFEKYEGIPTDKVPLNITFDKKILSLCSFIVYRPKVNESTAHYICYVFNENTNLWEIRDDTANTYSYTENIPRNIFLATLFYVVQE